MPDLLRIAYKANLGRYKAYRDTPAHYKILNLSTIFFALTSYGFCERNMETLEIGLNTGLEAMLHLQHGIVRLRDRLCACTNALRQNRLGSQSPGFANAAYKHVAMILRMAHALYSCSRGRSQEESA